MINSLPPAPSLVFDYRFPGADIASCGVPGQRTAPGSSGNPINDRIIIMFSSTEAAVIALIFVLVESFLN